MINLSYLVLVRMTLSVIRLAKRKTGLMMMGISVTGDRFGFPTLGGILEVSHTDHPEGDHTDRL